MDEVIDIENESESVFVTDNAVGAPDSLPDNTVIDYQELVNTLLQEVRGVGSVDSVSSGDSPLEDSTADESASDDGFSDVQIVQNVSDYDNFEQLNQSRSFLSSSSASVSEVGTTPPDVMLYNGAVWITGNSPLLGDDITIWVPSDTKGCWGTDSMGYLIWLGSASTKGYLDAGLQNPALTFGTFSYPRYRPDYSSSTVDLPFIPTNSNDFIATGDVPRLSVFDSLPLIAVALLGVIVLFLSKSRR